MNRNISGFIRWRSKSELQMSNVEWVLNVPTRAEYVAKLGEARIRGLGVKEHRYAAPVDYGY
jgi:glutaconate CoA-transferase subunit A